MPTKTKDIRQFRNFILSKYPNITKAQLEEVDQFIAAKQVEQMAQLGIPIEEIESKDPAKLNAQYGQALKGEYKAKPNEDELKQAAVERRITAIEKLWFPNEDKLALDKKPDNAFERTKGQLSKRWESSSEYKLYTSTLKSMGATLAKAAGDTGNIAWAEQAAQLNLMANAGAVTPEEAQKQFVILREMFGLEQKDESYYDALRNGVDPKILKGVDVKKEAEVIKTAKSPDELFAPLEEEEYLKLKKEQTKEATPSAKPTTTPQATQSAVIAPPGFNPEQLFSSEQQQPAIDPTKLMSQEVMSREVNPQAQPNQENILAMALRSLQNPEDMQLRQGVANRIAPEGTDLRGFLEGFGGAQYQPAVDPDGKVAQAQQLLSAALKYGLPMVGGYTGKAMAGKKGELAGSSAGALLGEISGESLQSSLGLQDQAPEELLANTYKAPRNAAIANALMMGLRGVWNGPRNLYNTVRGMADKSDKLVDLKPLAEAAMDYVPRSGNIKLGQQAQLDAITKFGGDQKQKLSVLMDAIKQANTAFTKSGDAKSGAINEVNQIIAREGKSQLAKADPLLGKAYNLIEPVYKIDKQTKGLLGKMLAAGAATGVGGLIYSKLFKE